MIGACADCCRPGVHALGLLTLWFAVVLIYFLFIFLFSFLQHPIASSLVSVESRIKSSFYFLSTLPPPPSLPIKRKKEKKTIQMQSDVSLQRFCWASEGFLTKVFSHPKNFATPTIY